MKTPISYVPVSPYIIENTKLFSLGDELGTSHLETLGLWVALLGYVARNNGETGEIDAGEAVVLRLLMVEKPENFRNKLFSALKNSDLVFQKKEKLFIKNWDDYVGGLLKKRESWRNNKRKQRVTDTPADGVCPNDVPRMSRGRPKDVLRTSTPKISKDKISKDKISKGKVSASPEARPNGIPPDPVDQIFAHWQTYHPTKHATTKRIDAIRKVLPEISNEGGAGAVETIKKAIDGYHISPFHLGENVEGKQWLDLTLICRGRDQVLAGLELFNEHAPKPPPKLKPEKIIREKLNAFGVDYGLGRPHPAEFQALLKIDPTIEELQQVAKKIPPRTPESTWTAYCRELCQIRSAA